MKRSRQMSESIEMGIVLAIVGGFMDAYSYICRDQVFANAQTGNILLLGVNIAEGNVGVAIRYLFPIVSFAIGIALADIARRRQDKSTLHWRQNVVLCEAVVLAIVGQIPNDFNLLANSLTSLACGIQVESFRKIHGNGIATTMCIGNLRSGTQSISEYLHTKNGEAAKKSMLYFGIIFCFVIGAVLGNEAVKAYQEKAILFSTAVLCVAFAMMFVDREKETVPVNQCE